MRIVYYLPDLDGGVSRIVANLLKFRPRSSEIEYAVVLIRRSDLTNKPFTDDLYADEIIRFRYDKNDNAHHICKRLKKTLRSNEDIIVGNDGLEIKMVVTQKLLNPVVYIVHGDFSTYYSLIQQYHTAIDIIITYSNLITKKVSALKNINNKKVQKIYYPVDTELNNISRVCFKSNIFKILFVGWLNKRKGVDLLPEIYHRLSENYLSDFEFEIIGDGEMMPFLKDKFALKSNVIIKGWQTQDDVRKAMTQADIFLFPSRLEGLPNVLVEALSTGCVPISSDLESGVPDIIIHNKNGLIVQTGNADKFAEAIYLLYSNNSFLSSLRINALDSIKKFNPYLQAKEYQNAYLKAINSSYIYQQKHPPFIKGRVLDLQHLPNFVVKIIRKIIKDPRL